MLAAVRKAAQYAQVDALLVKRNSQRSIACATGVARMTIAKRVKKAAAPSPTLLRLRPKKAQRKRWEALELDEIWAVKSGKYGCGWLSSGLAAALWAEYRAAGAKPCYGAYGPRYRSGIAATAGHFTDLWKAYAKGLPRWQHRPGPKGKRTLSKPSIVRCASAVAHSCANPVPSASR